MTKNPKLIPTRVPVKLPSGKSSTAIRHKNLAPVPGANTPSAGPVVKPQFDPTVEERLPAKKPPMLYAGVMGGYSTISVFDDEEEVDAICAETHRVTLEGRDAWDEPVTVEVEWRPMRLEDDPWSASELIEVAYVEDEPPVSLWPTGHGNLELAWRLYPMNQAAGRAQEIDADGDDELGPGEYRVLAQSNLVY